jgi:enoyl-CoA hydratase/carnithine racemase
MLGAGFGLATCADIIVDSRNALFGLAEAKGGIMDEFGGILIATFQHCHFTTA